MKIETGDTLKRQLLESLAIVLIGDGVVGLVQTQRHLRLWRVGPERWQRSMRELERRPGLTRMLSAAEAALGLWLAARQHPAVAGRQAHPERAGGVRRSFLDSGRMPEPEAGASHPPAASYQ